MTLTIEKGFRVVRINAPEWFDRDDFGAFVRRYASPSKEDGRRLATWHTGEGMTEYSDVFVIYDKGEYSDPLPDDVMDDVTRELEQQGVEHAVMWISNLSL